MKFRLKFSLLFISCFLLGINESKSQTSQQVHIKDIVLMPDNDLHPADTINVYYKLVVKIDVASLGNKIHILLGSSMNLGNVSTSLGVFSNTGSNYTITYNSQQFPIVKYSIALPIKFPTAYFNTLQYLTVYVEDNSGNFSNKLYYSFNP